MYIELSGPPIRNSALLALVQRELTQMEVALKSAYVVPEHALLTNAMLQATSVMVAEPLPVSGVAWKFMSRPTIEPVAS
jgi:hypothetical protein